MLRLSLVIFLRDRDRPRPLPPEVADLPDCLDARDLADLDADRPLFTDLLFDRFLFSFLEALLLRLRPSFLSFLPELLLLALLGVDFLADRLPDFFFEPLFGLLYPRADIVQLLLPERDLTFRVSLISLSMSYMRLLRCFFSVASIISDAINSRLLENSSTMELNWDTWGPRFTEFLPEGSFPDEL